MAGTGGGPQAGVHLENNLSLRFWGAWVQSCTLPSKEKSRRKKAESANPAAPWPSLEPPHTSPKPLRKRKGSMFHCKEPRAEKRV